MRRLFVRLAFVTVLGGCSAASRDPQVTSGASTTTVAFDWNAPIPTTLSTPPPSLNASIHFPVTFDFGFTLNDVSFYKSPDFVDGRPQAQTPDPRRTVHCYALGTRAGTFTHTGPYAVTSTWGYSSVYSDWSDASISLSLASNPEGLESLWCGKGVEGQVPNLTISFDEVRRAFANESTGTYIELTGAPASDTPAGN